MKPIITVLDNGFTVIKDHIQNYNSVAIKLWVKTGSRSETSANNGIAHFLEHMAFKGTKLRSAYQIAKEFDELGGHFNAATSREYTVYYVKILGEFVEKAFEIISDIMLNSVFDEQEILREKSVVLEEIAQTEDTPDDIIFDKFFDAVYPDQSFGRPILGSKESVENLTSNDLRDFVDNFYFAENMLLSISGGIDCDDSLRYAKRYFGSLKSKNDKPKFDKPEYACCNFRNQKDLEQAHLIFGFPSFGYNKSLKKNYTAQVASIILGGSMSSKLFQEVREKRGLAYSISSFNSAYFDTGIFGIYSATEPKNLTELSSVVFDEVCKFEYNVTENELNRAKNQIKSSVLMGMESNESRAAHMAKNFHYLGRHVPKDEVINILNSITMDDISSIAREIFQEKRLSVAVLGNIATLPSYENLLQMLNG